MINCLSGEKVDNLNLYLAFINRLKKKYNSFLDKNLRILRIFGL